jgi:hypothetical protein
MKFTKNILVDGKLQEREIQLASLGHRLNEVGVFEPYFLQASPKTNANEAVIRSMDGSFEVVTIKEPFATEPESKPASDLKIIFGK